MALSRLSVNVALFPSLTTSLAIVTAAWSLSVIVTLALSLMSTREEDIPLKLVISNQNCSTISGSVSPLIVSVTLSVSPAGLPAKLTDVGLKEAT